MTETTHGDPEPCSGARPSGSAFMAVTLMLILRWLLMAPGEAVLGTDPNGVTSALTGARLLVTLIAAL